MSEKADRSNVVPARALEAARRRAREQHSATQAAEMAQARATFVEALYRRHWGDLCKLMARLYGPGPPEPEDLAQAAFTKITQLERFDHIRNPRAFLFKVAVNIALKSIGRIARTRAFLAEQLNDPDIMMEEISPERVYEDRERLDAVERAMAGLTPKQREIVVRSRIKGETYAQISAAKGWSQADISRQLKAALAVLEEARDAATDPDSDETGQHTR